VRTIKVNAPTVVSGSKLVLNQRDVIRKFPLTKQFNIDFSSNSFKRSLICFQIPSNFKGINKKVAIFKKSNRFKIKIHYKPDKSLLLCYVMSET